MLACVYTHSSESYTVLVCGYTVQHIDDHNKRIKAMECVPTAIFSESSDKPINITAVIKELRTSLMIA